MEVQYKREARGNFLVIEPTWTSLCGYEVKMLSENAVEGLLFFHIKYVDEKQFYYYDITSLQPLSRMLEGRWIHKEEVCRLLLELDAVLKRAGEYLLDGDGLLLEPDYIYTDTQWSRIRFCLVPGWEGNFQDSLSRLLQYILKKTDHRDPEGVVLSYGLYQESLKENYGIENLLLLIHQVPKVQGDKENQKRENQNRENQNREYQNREYGEPEEESEEPREEMDGDEGRQTGEDRWTFWKKRAAAGLGWLASALAFQGILWLFGGWSALKRWGPVGAAGISVVFAAAIAVSAILKRRQKAEGEERREIPERVFDEQTEDISIAEEEEEDMKTAGEQRLTYFQTVPLFSAEEGAENCRYLEPKEAGMERIQLPYFPFIIGKQEELVDYCLKEETVSRLHLRIDQEEGEYLVTDLNSTNGTAVNGRQLEANETVPIQPGDELLIAKIFYRFQ